jgi:adenylate kinase family enzyme
MTGYYALIQVAVVGRSALLPSIGIVRRVAVIGCGGAGKTTFANELGRRLGLLVLHVDSFYWRDHDGTGQRESTPEEWHQTHEEMIGREQWVIDGMKLGVLRARLPQRTR